MLFYSPARNVSHLSPRFSTSSLSSEKWQNWNPLGSHRAFFFAITLHLHRTSSAERRNSLAKFVVMKNDIKSHFSLLFSLRNRVLHLVRQLSQPARRRTRWGPDQTRPEESTSPRLVWRRSIFVLFRDLDCNCKRQGTKKSPCRSEWGRHSGSQIAQVENSE